MCSKLLVLVTALSEEKGVPIPDLVKAFGRHLFGKFFADNEETLKSYRDSFELLLAVEEIIHVEIRKLWATDV
ncbi:MAG: heme NO-binding domain-containing protein [Planctomycetota bacterium]|nr:heme NO-binding domain-containing protein [Planctomycetota bacterium]